MAATRSLMRLGTGRALSSATRSSARAFSTTALKASTIPDVPNMRHAQRSPEGPLRAPVINPADKHSDKAEALHKYGQYIMSCLPKHVQQFSVWKDELCIYVPPSGLIPTMTFLKYHTAAEYTQISDITGVDFPTRDQRFEVVYNMLSVRYNSRIRVKTYADEASPVPSVTGLFEGALWYEREVYDMFGVFFTGHPDLRRIMTDYGFDGHPLRKDFPLTGYTELRYDEEKKRIVIEPLELTQAFRNFESGSTAWEPVGAGTDRTPESEKETTPLLEKPPSQEKHTKMPKRKLSEVTDKSDPRSLHIQTHRLKTKYSQGVESLTKALKLARGFERQKWKRRENRVKDEGKADAVERMAEEARILKELDPSKAAQKYLYKQLLKTKRIAESPTFKEFQEHMGSKLSAEGPKNNYEANVTARLIKSTPVQNVFPGIMDGIRALLKVDDKKPAAAAEKQKKEQGANDKADKKTKKKDDKKPEQKNAAADEVSGSESEGLSRSRLASGEGDEDVSMDDAESVDYAQYDGLLASGSDDDEDDEMVTRRQILGDSDDEDDEDGDDVDGRMVQRRAPSDISISRSPTPEAVDEEEDSDSPPSKKSKSVQKGSAKPATSTTFLPSLMMGGYWSGSESEAEDIDRETAEPPRRKNRMGQQARRALWEKKYGAGANHVKQEQQKGKKGRDGGWDARKGATDGSGGPRGRYGHGAGPGRGRPQYDDSRPQRGPPKKPQDDKPLHPSWEAAKKAKEQKATAAFAGKKVVFE
ncbi:BUD22-domain-containing protein [Aspergillus homomorphus CBS 101889]|uniref:BUD22-domain-containing protein n=1 Tax=Aspergillus homomorphus (strain CBS 101889) TaxID=1450537 RepID=A0A395IBZ7_ASPHC|nr:BUD22-domain-containing protein [Aspergillus homomorphus CBS 101889]RAL17319.1 BUD22-domain-containing protein [Aspergillus homomorphus CBS 101889]